MALTIERSGPDDGPAIVQLLSKSGLPIDGVLDHLGTAIVARAEGHLVGCAALEVYADGALLRSLAVDDTVQGRGIGSQLTAAILDLASSLDIPAAYLLTTTADGFFPKFGFECIRRADVPPGVRGSIEFESACPATATVMRRVLIAERQRDR
jgi:amino-acid N-acetyltransferase